MKKMLLFAILSFLILIPIVMPAGDSFTFSLVEAQSEGLVPCDGSIENPCNACSLMTLANNIITLAFTLLSIIVVLMIMYSGFRLVVSQGDPGAWSNAKGMFTNVIIGFIIVLSAWLIVDTFMKVLVGNENTKFGMWHTLKDGCGDVGVRDATN